MIRQSTEARFSNKEVIPPDSTGEDVGRYANDVFAMTKDTKEIDSEE